MTFDLHMFILTIKGVIYVAQAMVNFRMDEDLKKKMEQTCKDMGLSMTTAFTIFANKVTKEKRIPFEVAVEPDPFYSEANMQRLRIAIADAEMGVNMTEHELLEVEDD